MKYSLKRGFSKGFMSFLTVFLAFAVFAGFADFSLKDLIEQYVFPLLGGMTVSGMTTMLINYLKVKSSM